jgi:hypothetical protein
MDCRCQTVDHQEHYIPSLGGGGGYKIKKLNVFRFKFVFVSTLFIGCYIKKAQQYRHLSVSWFEIQAPAKEAKTCISAFRLEDLRNVAN